MASPALIVRALSDDAGDCGLRVVVQYVLWVDGFYKNVGLCVVMDQVAVALTDFCEGGRKLVVTDDERNDGGVCQGRHERLVLLVPLAILGHPLDVHVELWRLERGYEWIRPLRLDTDLEWCFLGDGK